MSAKAGVKEKLTPHEARIRSSLERQESMQQRTNKLRETI